MQPSTIGLRRRARARHDLLARHPHGALDAAIEAARRVVAADPAAERHAQEAARLLRLFPEIDADQRLGVEGPGRFFERLADDRVDELLARSTWPAGWLNTMRLADALFDEQELAVAFDDGGDGEVGSKDHEGSISG